MDEGGGPRHRLARHQSREGREQQGRDRRYRVHGGQGPHPPTAATLWRDALAPAAPSQPDLTAASDDGASGSDNVTGKTALVLTGTAEPTATVTLYRGSTVVSTASAAFDGGAWTASRHGAGGRRVRLHGDGDRTGPATSRPHPRR